MIPWYKLYIRMWDDSLRIRYIQAENKWDLFAVIGWLHSTYLEHIERIDYEAVKRAIEVEIGENSSRILRPDKLKYQPKEKK